MSNLSLRDLAEPDRTGVGVSRAAVLADVIKKGTPIPVSYTHLTLPTICSV